MDGILNISKPRDMTSFGVVSRVKRITGEKHCGHAGTLDPLATGVLPICLGQGTRVTEYLFDETKTYRAEVELGITTDTYDSTGQVTCTADASGISREMIETALPQFRGSIRQVPPVFSAIRHQGKYFYELARAGTQLAPQSRPAQIFSLEITDWQPPVVTLDITCGKGTYIRSLAHDLGEALGCGAHVINLIRLKVGPFDLADALTLPRLEEAFQNGYGSKYLYPLDFVLLPFSAVVVGPEQQCSLVHGAPIALDPGLETRLSAGGPTGRCRAYTAEGYFLGMLKYEVEDSRWWPEKIFFKGCCQ
jgi:tRNA pseudouridine55 synthase